MKRRRKRDQLDNDRDRGYSVKRRPWLDKKDQILHVVTFSKWSKGRRSEIVRSGRVAEVARNLALESPR